MQLKEAVPVNVLKDRLAEAKSRLLQIPHDRAALDREEAELTRLHEMLHELLNEAVPISQNGRRHRRREGGFPKPTEAVLAFVAKSPGLMPGEIVQHLRMIELDTTAENIPRLLHSTIRNLWKSQRLTRDDVGRIYPAGSEA